jgi:hypothetical protein
MKITDLVGALLSSFRMKGREKPRAPRVPLVPLHRVTFSAHLPETAPRVIAVANISSGGLGLISEESVRLPHIGEQLKGTLTIDGEDFSVVMRVAHQSGKLTGCQFFATPATLKDHVERYFSAELTGKSLSEVNPEILKAEVDGRPRWFRGSGSSEVYLVQGADEGLLRFRASFLGLTVEGAKGKALRHGFVTTADPVLDEDGEGAKYKGSPVAHYVTGRPPADVLQAIQRLVGQVQGLSQPLKNEILTMIEGA